MSSDLGYVRISTGSPRRLSSTKPVPAYGAPSSTREPSSTVGRFELANTLLNIFEMRLKEPEVVAMSNRTAIFYDLSTWSPSDLLCRYLYREVSEPFELDL